ncbi:MAG TPA: YdeI/OmpD-associated family protein [Actinomycetota bacterium]|nr:YdeI/OmpD-associated family protein [Actinomycetota bacterium]
MTGPPPKPKFFATASAFRKWLEANHEKKSELWVGFHRKASGKGGITYSEAVDQALCFGWIDGVRKSWDDDSHMMRFTPRRPRSIWSAVNIRKFEELQRRGLVRPAGMAAFERRSEDRSRVYSFEQETVELPKEFERRFRASRDAWKWFSTQPPSYRRPAIWWVVSAKREETRRRRLDQLIDDSQAERRIKHLSRG